MGWPGGGRRGKRCGGTMTPAPRSDHICATPHGCPLGKRGRFRSVGPVDGPLGPSAKPRGFQTIGGQQLICWRMSRLEGCPANPKGCHAPRAPAGGATPRHRRATPPKGWPSCHRPYRRGRPPACRCSRLAKASVANLVPRYPPPHTITTYVVSRQRFAMRWRAGPCLAPSRQTGSPGHPAAPPRPGMPGWPPRPPPAPPPPPPPWPAAAGGQMRAPGPPLGRSRAPAVAYW